MSKKTIAELRDFVRFAFKTYQDVIHAALTKDDFATVETVAKEFNKSLQEFFEQAPQAKAQVERYKFQLAHPQAGDDEHELSASLQSARERVDAAEDLTTAKLQIFFGLAARAVELFLADNGDKAKKLQCARIFFCYLPNDLPRLVTLFASISDDHASDVWGWHWWNFNPDGEVHTVDTFTRSNRLFILLALKILADQQNVVEPSPPDNAIYLFDATNNQGVRATMTQMEQNWASYDGLIDERAREQVARLSAILENMKAAGEAAREEKLTAALLDEAKVRAFKETVVTSFDRFSRLRNIVAKLSKLTDRSSEPPPAGLQALGYNQLDEKGAFVADWHVHFSGWGESYGRGLAQAEDNIAFETMIEGAETSLTVAENDLVPEITKQLKARRWSKPVMLQTLRGTLEYSQIRNRENFIPRYSRELPEIPERDIEGFIGVMKVDTENVPVFDIFVHNPNLADKVILTELSKYVEWNRYSPLDEGAPSGDVLQLLQIKVIDLNLDDKLRQRILQEAPDWLTDKGDAAKQEQYLRTHVVVNVYDKFKLKVLNRAAAVCLDVVGSPATEAQTV